MSNYAILWSGIVDSSLWEEDSDVVKVFMTILATKDSDHVCHLDAYRIAKKCNFRTPAGLVDEVKILGILKILASPDKHRSFDQEFEGRRIRAVEDGWLVLNGAKYYEKMKEMNRKARLRRGQAAWRARQKAKGKPLPGEDAAVKAYQDGGSEAEDRVTTSYLPNTSKGGLRKEGFEEAQTGSHS